MMLPSIFGENLFDRWMDSPFQDDFFGSKNLLYGKYGQDLMKTDIRETDNSYEIDIDLPGFKKDEINAQLQNGYLTISTERSVNNDEKAKDGTYIRRERYSGSMSRSFYVGEQVKQEDIHAKFEDGILRLNIPKKDMNAVAQKNYISIEG